MRKQYVAGALLGAVLGFAGQWALYCTGRLPFPPAVLITGSAQVDEYMRSTRHIDECNLSRARELWCEAKLLTFLESNGEAALRSTLLAAFLGLASGLAAHKVLQRSQNT